MWLKRFFSILSLRKSKKRKERVMWLKKLV
nr:MAG TPA: hypothetical protein [Caudoviricetes sp.]